MERHRRAVISVSLWRSTVAEGSFEFARAMLARTLTSECISRFQPNVGLIRGLAVRGSFEGSLLPTSLALLSKQAFRRFQTFLRYFSSLQDAECRVLTKGDANVLSTGGWYSCYLPAAFVSSFCFLLVKTWR